MTTADPTAFLRDQIMLLEVVIHVYGQRDKAIESGDTAARDHWTREAAECLAMYKGATGRDPFTDIDLNDVPGGR